MAGFNVFMNKGDRNSIIIAVLWALPAIFISFWIAKVIGVGSDSDTPWILSWIIWLSGVWLLCKIFKLE